MTSGAAPVNHQASTAPAIAAADYPRVLHIDTTTAPEEALRNRLWQDKIDYRCYGSSRSRWRRVEMLLRLDFGLARRAMAMAGEYDVLFCGSEKVGIPLALLGCRKPIVTVVHNVARRPKAALIKLLGVAQRWAKIGVYTRADGRFIVTELGCKPENVFNYASAPLDRVAPGATSEGPILSAGASARDYTTLFAALSKLPQHRAQIFASSRYDRNRSAASGAPPWVSVSCDVPHQILVQELMRARFVVVPLLHTTQYSAGCSVILEAMCAAKAVIATKTAGSVDYVQDGITGLLVPPRDSGALRDAIQKLWQDPVLAHRMGLAGRAFVEANYNPAHVGPAVRATIRAAHAEAPPARARRWT